MKLPSNVSTALDDAVDASRRTMRWRLGASAPLLLGNSLARLMTAESEPARPVLSKEDDAFLDELQRATFRFFADCAHPTTGLVKDRNRVSGKDGRHIASIAATGFGLTALCWRISGVGCHPRKRGSVRGPLCNFSANKCPRSAVSFIISSTGRPASASGNASCPGPPALGSLDGSLVPCAAGGSLAFLPRESIRCQRTMRERFGAKACTRYGFADAFNPADFMKNEEVRKALQKAGFRTIPAVHPSARG